MKKSPFTRRRQIGGLGALAAIVLRFATVEVAAAPIQVAGHDVQLILSDTGDGGIRLQVLPLEEETKPPAPSSGVLVSFPSKELLRARELMRAELRCRNLRITVTNEPLSVTVRRENGDLVQQLDFEGRTLRFAMNAPVFGLGEGGQQFDRRGALHPMNPTWGVRERPFRGSIVPSPFLIGTEGWALFVHQPAGQFDLRESRGSFIPKLEANSRVSMDLFLASLQEPADALTHYTRWTGQPAMPPKWALGYMQSHRTLSGPDQPLAIAGTFREKKLPCDAVIYLGTGYCPSGWNTGHGSLEFNPAAFDQPAAQIAALHELNFKVVLHVNGAPVDLFGSSLNESSDSPKHIGNYWARHRQTFALGVDGWWPDDGDELPLDARLARHQVYYEGAVHDRPDLRPWSLHRTGYAGSQRYGGWIWSGDADSRWSVLAHQIPSALNHGLSLTPFWGSDTGGFFPTPELTGELYARWFQFSAFCASFRSHGRTWNLRLPWGWNTGEFGPKEHPDREHPPATELHNAAIEPICRRYLELRYRLLPYNYTAAHEATRTGLPMMRALWLHYPKDPEATKLGDEYLWGRDILVAPVVEKGAATRRVYLPAGSWHDWWTGKKIEGGRWIERTVDLATIPLYVRAGAIIPLDPVRQYTEQPVSEPTTIRIFPGADGMFTLHDDYHPVRFHWDNAARTLAVESIESLRSWSGQRRVFTVEAIDVSGPPRRVEFRGERVEIKL